MSDSHYDFLHKLAERDGVDLWLARETNVGVSRLVLIKQIVAAQQANAESIAEK